MQSEGTFLTRGVTLSIQVEGNNYEGQGLFGEVMAVSPPHGESSGAGRANSHTAIGNVLLYGLTSASYLPSIGPGSALP